MSLICRLVQITLAVWVLVIIVSLYGCSTAEDRAFRVGLVEKQLEYQSRAKPQPPLAKIELFES